MAIGPQIFQVLTEFKFEIAGAVANTKALKDAVESISTAAEEAMASFQRLGLGLIGTGGILGVLGAALQASDKFGQSQRVFANIISSNMEHLTGSIGTFQERMATSAVIMEHINKLAQEFSLPSTDLLDTTKLLAATLVPKGLAGTNFGTAIDLSRNFLKAAPTLGVDPGLAKGQLLDAIQGRASLQDTLFQRLMNETKEFRQFNKTGGPQAFNALPAAERVKLLGAALKQFASDADVLTGNARSLSGEMRRLSEAIKGPFSILKPLGDTILIPLLDLLHKFNTGLQGEGKQMIENLAKFIKPFIENPEQLLINLLQLKKLKKDTALAGKGAEVIGITMAITHALHFFGIGLSAGRIALVGFTRALMLTLEAFAVLGGWLATFLIWITGATTLFGALFVILNGLVVVASAVLVPFLLLLGLFQLISRAQAIAKVEDAKAFIKSAPLMTEAIARLSQVVRTMLAPFTDLFNQVADFISPVFRLSYYFDGMIWVVNRLADSLLLAQATIEGIFFSIFEIINQAKSFVTGGGFNFKAIGDAFNSGMDDAITRNLDAIKNGTGATVQQTTNIGKVEIQNNFKEQMEPDRIAFTMKDQLLKAAQNPGQASGRSLAGAFSR